MRWIPAIVLISVVPVAANAQLPRLLDDDPMVRTTETDAWRHQAPPSVPPVVLAPEKNEKSRGLAALLSALVPGAGQVYMGAKAKGALFFGLEAAALGMYFQWRKQGKDKEDDFRRTADAQWNPLDYLAWRDSAIARNSSFTHTLPCSSYVAEYLETGRFGACDPEQVQQYYELIGKYDQFVVGWIDVTEASSGNPARVAEVDSVENYRSENRFAYEDQRNESNKLLKRASSLTGVILINHALSMIDAARMARQRNRGANAEHMARRTRFVFGLYPWNRMQIPMLVAYKPF